MIRAVPIRLGLPALLLGCGASAPAAPRPLAVAAASSLRELLERSAPGFEVGRPGVRLVFSFEGSSVLARRIGMGAPFDLFLSADEETLRRVEDRIDQGTVVPFLSNRLALLVRADLAPAPAGPGDLPRLSGRIAVGGPAVPAGRYARAFLEKEGLLEAIGPRIADAGSVRGALALVESGAADAAFVYETDARLARRARLAWVAPDAEGPEVLYFAAALSGADSRAREFIGWLRSPAFEAQALAMGFRAPTR